MNTKEMISIVDLWIAYVAKMFNENVRKKSKKKNERNEKQIEEKKNVASKKNQQKQQ